ncbi:MAG: hypothetical protein WEC84_03480 [Candidatus Andersenbacteria bacterium]
MQTLSSIQHIISSWPSRSRKLAGALTEKYGMPHEAADSFLVWYYNSPWKRTILHREGAPHNFPKAHVDILEQVVDYKVQPEKVGELVQFNGSLLIDRTRGELSVRCASERMNTLILNLAHRIAVGELSCDDARTEVVNLLGTFRFHWLELEKSQLSFGPGYVADRERDPADPDVRGGVFLRRNISDVQKQPEEAVGPPTYSH